MAIIESGASPDLLVIDQTSAAARVTLYDAQGNVWSAVPISGSVAISIAQPVGVSGTVTVGNFPSPAGVSGTVTSQIAGPLGVSGTVTASISAPLGVSGTVTVSAPLAVSGTVTVNSPLAISGSVSFTADLPISGSVSTYNPPGCSGSWLTDDYLNTNAAVPIAFTVTPGSPIQLVNVSISGTTFASSSGTQFLPTRPPPGYRFWLLGWNLTTDNSASTILFFRDGVKAASAGNTVCGTDFVLATNSAANWHYADFGPYGLPLTLGNAVWVSSSSATVLYFGNLWGYITNN